jgi:hypothetical protein
MCRQGNGDDERSIRSLIAAAAQEPAEVAAFPCIDVVETAADKLSALAWRVRVRRRGKPKSSFAFQKST